MAGRRLPPPERLRRCHAAARRPMDGRRSAEGAHAISRGARRRQPTTARHPNLCSVFRRVPALDGRRLPTQGHTANPEYTQADDRPQNLPVHAIPRSRVEPAGDTRGSGWDGTPRLWSAGVRSMRLPVRVLRIRHVEPLRGMAEPLRGSCSSSALDEVRLATRMAARSHQSGDLLPSVQRVPQRIPSDRRISSRFTGRLCHHS